MDASGFGRYWQMCNENICLYDGNAKVRRCIKHGAILDYIGPRFDGMTRAQVREKLKREADAFAKAKGE